MLVNVGLDINSYTKITEPHNIRKKIKKKKNTMINKRKQN